MQATGKLPKILGKVLKALTLLLLPVMSYSICGCYEDEPDNSSIRDSLKAARDSALLKSKDNSSRTEFEGLYNYDITGSTFRDCRYPDSVYLVSNQAGKLKDEFKRIYPTSNVYGSIVVKLKGELVPTVEQKFKDKYPTTLKVTEVLSASSKNPNNTCIPYDFWAFGNEPNWSMQISQKEGIIELYNSADNKVYSFFWNEPKERNDTIVYSSFNTVRKYTIDVSLFKTPCKDSMSGEEFDYSVNVAITDMKGFKGCAFRGK